MPQPLVVNVPHRLGREVVRQRLQGGIAQFKAEFAQNVTAVRDTWTGDDLNLQVVALGQSVTARAQVRDDHVRVEVDLPWMLAMLADRIRGRVETDARRLLEGPGRSP
jgi:hypothetical protein